MCLLQYAGGMKTVIMTRGLQGSGKSTWARQLMKDEPGVWSRINKDDIRTMLYGSDFVWSKELEKSVYETHGALLRTLLRHGQNVVVDNTNLSSSAMKQVHEIAEEVGDVTVTDKVFDTPLLLCIERDAARVKPVGEAVIRDAYRRYGKNISLASPTASVHYPPRSEGATAVQDPTLPEAIIVDLDGTAALMNGRSPYDAAKCDQDLPNVPVIETVKAVHLQRKCAVLFVSGRDAKHRAPTETFLQRHFWISRQRYTPASISEGTGVTVEPITVPMPYQLFMRPEGDTRKDTLIKKEIYEREILGKYRVLNVYDDRDCVVRLWREELGLTCFQVAEGKF